MGTSFTVYIFRLGPCNIFLTVPLVDLNTDKVIIYSNFKSDYDPETTLKLDVSKVEKALD